MHISVILPTYNERENIRIIIPQIAAVLNSEQLSYEILVIDDNSPDGTAEAARLFASEYPIHTTVRTLERGLASAVILGFSQAKGEIIVVMDADLSHPVTKLPEMIAPIRSHQCDITVGSRNISGGGCTSWPYSRRFISRMGGLLAFGLTNLTDPTSGFMAVRSSILSGLHLDPVGWKIVLEVVTRSGAKLKEVPIIFTDRIHGESKLTAAAQLQYLIHLFKLYEFRLPNLWQLVKFCLVGASGLIIDLFVLTLLVELSGLDPRIAVAGSFTAAVAWNYLLDHSWTFRAPTIWNFVTFFQFLIVCLGGLFIRITIHSLLVETGMFYLVANIIGVLAATVANFLGSKFIVFAAVQPKLRKGVTLQPPHR